MSRLERAWCTLRAHQILVAPVVSSQDPTHTLRHLPDQSVWRPRAHSCCLSTRTPLCSVPHARRPSNRNSSLGSCSTTSPSGLSACSLQNFTHRTQEGWLSSHQRLSLPPPLKPRTVSSGPSMSLAIPTCPDNTLTCGFSPAEQVGPHVVLPFSRLPLPIQPLPLLTPSRKITVKS